MTTAAKAVAGLPKAATAGEGSAGAKGLTAASAALKSVSAVAALEKGAVSAEVSVGVSSSKEKTSESIESARVAQVQAGRDVTVTAGEDITGEGLQVTAGRDVTLDAGDDITLTAAQSTYALDHESSSKSASAGISVGIGVTGTPTVSANGSISANASDRNVDSLTHTNSRIFVGNDVILKSGDDTTLKGAQVQANGSIDADVGGDLTVASVQDTSRIDGNSKGGSLGLSTGLDGKVDALNGSVSYGKEKGRKAWVEEQSALIAKGNVDVTVGGHTQLDGSRSLPRPKVTSRWTPRPSTTPIFRITTTTKTSMVLSPALSVLAVMARTVNQIC